LEPAVLHRLNFATRPITVDEVSALGLQIAFLDMGRQSPVFLGGQLSSAS
jgi:hypothetical protein